MSIDFRYVAHTDRGLVRERNEDAVRIFAPHAEAIVALVCDGMGGHQGGGLASDTAIRILEKIWKENHPHCPPDQVIQCWYKGFAEVQAKLNQFADKEPELSLMGTTCTGVFLDAITHQAHWAHIGDSRLYLFRNQILTQISEDHTLVQRWVREGKLKPEEVWQHPRGNVLWQALSAGSKTTIYPDTGVQEVQPGDCLVLCSDGLSDMIRDQDIARMLLQPHSDIDERARQIVAAANEAGGRDNISLILIEVE